MVELASPTSTSIVNANEKFLSLTGWTRQQLVARPYSSISPDEPRAWSAHYRSLADDTSVQALHMSNVGLSTADGSKIIVNLHARRLVGSECSTSLTACISIVTAGIPDEKPQIRVQQRGDASFRDVRFDALSP